ncbi:MAG: Hpt domain-containing protein, partial [Kangiellaceae bacterium]|nr:Hpt domain-containing protein [Kangiellaceae bacterium]
MAETNEQLALSWVRKEINKSLDEARQGLEGFAENNSDVTQMRFCISSLHQVRGTLHMLEFYGASLFAEEMEQLANAIAENKITNYEKSLEVLMASMLQLPSYLDRVQEGKRDLPVVLLPMLNDLRSARGAAPVSESAIFPPQISGVEPPKPEAGAKPVDQKSFADLAKKFRGHYQKGLLSVMRGENVKEGIQRMHKVLEKLEEVTSGYAVAHLWWVADGFIFSILEKNQYKDSAVHALLGRVDRQIKQLADVGASALDDKIPDDLLQNLLFYVAKSTSKNEKVLRLKEQFNLDSVLPSEEVVEEERRKMQGPDSGAINTVVAAINDDLINVKDSLDLLVRGNKSSAKLKELLPSMQKIADTLGILGLGIPRDVIKQQITTLNKILESGDDISDAVVMDVAGALLFVEANLSNVKPQDVGQSETSSPEELAAKQDKAASEAQFDDAKIQLLKASRDNLQKAKERIVDFIASSFDFKLIADVPVLLTEIHGGLQIVGFDEASKLLDKAQDFIEKKLLSEKIKPDEDVMDALADIVTSVEYCLENYGEIGSVAFDSVLGAAKESVVILERELAKVVATESAEEELEFIAEDLVLDQPLDTSMEEPVEQSAEENLDSQAAETVEKPVEASQPSEQSPEPKVEQAVEPPAAAPKQVAPPEVKAHDESLIDDDVLEIFLEEAEEEMESINEMYPKLQADPHDEESLSTIRRSFHTLKGSGRLVGASIAGELAWSIENMLNRVIDNTIKFDAPVFAVMKKAIDFMPSLIEAFSNKLAPAETPDAIMAEAHAVSRGETYIPSATEELEAPIAESVEQADVEPEAAQQESTVSETIEDDVAGLTVDADLNSASLEHEPDLEQGQEPVAAEDAPLTDDVTLDELPQIEERQTDEIELIEADFAADEEITFKLEDEPSLEQIADDLESVEASLSEEDDLTVASTDEQVEEIDFSDTLPEDIPELSAEDVDEGMTFEPVGVDDVLEISGSLDEEIPTLSLDDEAPLVSSEDTAESDHVADVSYQALADDTDPVLLEIFINEADSHLSVIHSDAQSWADNAQNKISDDLLRAMHTLKGSAHMAEVTEIAAVATPLELLAKEYKQRNIALTNDTKATIVAAHDYMTRCLDALKNNHHLHDPEKDSLVVQLMQEKESLAELNAAHDDAPDALHRDPELLGIFLAEGMDIVAEAQKLLQHWQQRGSIDSQHNLQAEMHTLKRGANMAMVEEVEQLAAALESFVSKPDQSTFDDEYYQLGSSALDKVLELLNTAAVEHELEKPDALIAQLKAWHAKSQQPMQAFEKAVVEPEEVSETILPEDVREADDEIDEELLEFFLEEAEELIDEIESNLEKWKSNPEDLLPVNNLQRNLHTFKGSARMAGIMTGGNVAHALEDVYEAIGSGRIETHDQHLELSFKVLDHIRSMVEELRDHQSYQVDNALLTQIQQALTLEFDEPAEQPAVSTEAETQPTESAESIEPTVEQADSEEIISEEPAVEELSSPQPETATDLVAEAQQTIQLDEDGEEVLEIYLEEAAEILKNMDDALQVWTQEPTNKESIETLQRSLHTLKGGARLSDLTALGDLTHELESYFEKVAASQVKVNRPEVDFVMRGYDVIQNLVDEVGASRMLTTPAAYMNELLALIKGGSIAAQPKADKKVKEADTKQPAAEQKQPAKVVPIDAKSPVKQEETEVRRSKQQDVVRMAAEQLESLVNLSGETSIFRSRLEQQMSVFRYDLDEMTTALERLREQLRNMEIETDAQIEYRREVAGVDYEEFDPLEFDRYTRQQELTRSLVESTSDIANLIDSLDNLASDSETLLLQQGRVNTEMQERLMRTRMVPFDSLVPRLRRIVRQIGNELGKAVDLSIAAEGEMDRTVLERMIAPIEHMLRNAMDHGIENIEDRKAAGKPETGRVKIRLFREGSEIFIEIQDDGRGLNIDAIKGKALERGLINEQSELSDHELQQLIFEAGFSTATKVTQISGRGVGMDVVSSEIKQMGGVVEINSVQGQGATFTVKLPFTVSVNQALMVNVGDDVYAVPLANIEGI